MAERDRPAATLSRNLDDPGPPPENHSDHLADDVSVDLEVEERLADWLDTNRVENSQPAAILYKFTGTGETKEQVDYFRGVIPSRNDIGLEYGAGRYMLILKNTTGRLGYKSTTIRFNLHESYNEKSLKFKRERAEKERFGVGGSSVSGTVSPPSTGKESLVEAITLVRSMQAETLNLFRPILERLLVPPPAPATLPAPVPKSATLFEEYALTKQILKDSLKENVQMFSMMQKNMLENRQAVDPDDNDDPLPDEKQGLFEKIIALAEPFIKILSENSMAAKMAAAGIKAAPAFKEVIQDAGLARRIISYVEQKEGPERAAMALKNLGINRGDYMQPVSPSPVIREQAPGPRKLLTPKKPPVKTKAGPQGATKAEGVKGVRGTGLNPKMEIKQ